MALLVLVLHTASCSAYYKVQSEKIAATTEALLQLNDFEKLYESLDETAKSLTPKAEFLERAEELVSFMKQADQDLKFHGSIAGGVNPDFSADIYFEYRSLGENADRIDVEFWISLNKGFPKLFDVCANPTNAETVDKQHCLTNALRKI